MSLSWGRFLFWFYLVFLVVADATVINPADPDLWHRLALGETLWRTGHFPPADTTSYLADYHQIADHEWGCGAIFYLLYEIGGLNVFILVKLVTLAWTVTLLAASGLKDRQPSMFLAGFYAVVIVALLSSFGSTVRCMTFTHVFFALWLYWYQIERHGERVACWWYAVTMVVWANLHGGFTIGLAWLALVAGMELVCGGSIWRWLRRLGLAGLATLINPFGWELWPSTARALFSPREGFAEWGPVPWWPPLASPGYKLLLVVVVVVMAVHVARKGWRGADRRVVLLLSAFVVLSLSAVRHTSLFAVVAGALAPGLFPRLSPEFEENPLRHLGMMGLRMTVIVLPLFSVFLFLGEGGARLSYPAISCPVGAVDFLKERHLSGDLLVPFNYGSYALWELRGRMRVSMDGRYDLVYAPATYRRVNDFFNAKGDWQGLLQNPRPAAILVRVEDPVYPKLKELPQWREVWTGAAGDSQDAVFLPR